MRRHVVVSAVCVALFAGLVPGAGAQPTFYRLDCDDASGPTEDEINPAFAGAASTETYTCVVTNNNLQPMLNHTVVAEVLDPVNDPDSPDGWTRRGVGFGEFTTRDYQCTTNSNGTCTIQVTQVEGEVGATAVCFRDVADAAFHCADEPWDEATSPNGTDTANDPLDTTLLMWEATGPVASRLDVEADTAASAIPGSRTVTAKVYDQFGEPFNGNTAVKLVFLSGSPSFTSLSDVKTCTTAGTSTCSFTWSQSQAGSDYLCTFLGGRTWASSGGPHPAECEDDRLYDPDDAVGVFDVPSIADRFDLVRVLWGDAARVDCDDPQGDTEQETRYGVETWTVVYTCAVHDAQREPLPAGTSVFGEATTASGENPNDPDDGTSYGSPDYSCTLGNSGTCQVVVDATEHQTGVLEACFYLYVQTAPTRCAEPFGATDRDFDDRILDSADTVRVQWRKRSALGSIEVSPTSAARQPGTQHTLTVTIYDVAGAPLADATKVDFEFLAGSPHDSDGTTLNTPDRTCTTSFTSPSCSISYTGTAAGRDLVCAWINHVPVVGADGTSCRSGGFPDNLQQEDQQTAKVFWSKSKTQTASRLAALR